jgi:hypothetical protein
VENESAFIVGSVVLFANAGRKFNAAVTGRGERTLTILPLGYAEDAPVGTSFPVGTDVGLGGLKGAVGDRGPIGPEGAKGPPGPSPISATTADFTVGTTQATVPVVDTTAFVVNSILLLSQGANRLYVKLDGKTATALTFTPITTVGNAPQGTVFNATASIGVVGAQGPQGIQGEIGKSPVTTTAVPYTVGITQFGLDVVDPTAFVPASTVIIASGADRVYMRLDSINGKQMTLTPLAAPGDKPIGFTFSAGALVAVAGAAGPQGIQGVKGDKGDKGDTGATGIQGPIGPQGPVGSATLTTQGYAVCDPALASDQTFTVADANSFVIGSVQSTPSTAHTHTHKHKHESDS